MRQKLKKLAKFAVGLISLVGIVYVLLILLIGVRIPGFYLDNYRLPTSHESLKDSFKISVNGGFLKETGHQFLIRAYSPSIEIAVTGHLINFPIIVENVHPEASLVVSNEKFAIEEEISNLSRTLIVHGEINSPLIFNWRFPDKNNYRFMAIGDTGGGKELQWALIRAKQLNADFVVHLGDMFYSPQDVHSAFNIIQNSPVPVYNVYGNHDYRNGEDEYPERNTFNDVFAPSNFQFSLLDKLFVSLDTSSRIFPFNKGKRGEFLEQIISESSQRTGETLVFTHKPILNDISRYYPEHDHGLTGFEGFWLETKLANINSITVITGHIHRSLEILNTILPTYIAGEGIAHTDLITGRPLSKVLVGDIYSNSPTKFSWYPNNMPRNYQVSKRSLSIWEKHQRNLAANNKNVMNSGL